MLQGAIFLVKCVATLGKNNQLQVEGEGAISDRNLHSQGIVGIAAESKINVYFVQLLPV